MKKKLWITSILAALSITAAAGGFMIADNQAVVTGAAENWQVGTMDNTYLYGTSFEVPAAEVEVNGQTVAATATVTYPNGLTTNEENVKLDQAGVYTVTYRAVVGDMHCVEEKTFTVENKGYFVQSEKSSVEYGTYTEYGANSEGVLVRLARGDTLTFSQLVDFDALTSADKLIEAFVTPDARGVYDFSTLAFTLTDPMDSSVYIRFQLKRWRSDTNGLRVSYADVSTYGQSTVGCERGNYKFNDHGTPIDHTFSAQAIKNNAWSGDAVEQVPDAFKFYIVYDPASTEVKARSAHVAYLNDPTLFEKTWEGFPSGKAKLTVTADEYVAETANFCITEIFGIDLSEGSFSEEDAPIVDVAMSQEEMPSGEIGYWYNIPQATAFDYYSGVCTVKTSVYRDYASASPISVGVVDGKFKPTVAGWHTIVYSSKDALGNEAIETRNVYISQALADIEVTLPENVVTEASLGSWVAVDPVTYVGGSGYANVVITVTFGDETIEITDGFLPEIAGDWTVKYTVTDYIGKVGTAEYAVNAQPGDGYVVLDELVLPQIFVSDSEYVLPEIYANDYASGKADHKLCSVVVTDKNGEKTYTAGDSFVPSVATNGDKVKISYQYNGEELIVREVPAVIVKGTGEIVAKNYLYGEGFSTSYKNENNEWYSAGIEIIADETSSLCGWTFATPQLVEEFTLLFEGIASRAKFESLLITLTDSQNADEAISISLKVKEIGTTVTVGDKVMEVAGLSLITDQQYTIAYNNGKFIVGGISIEATKTLSGEAFTGFSSNLAYVRVDMVNPNQGAGYKFLSMNEANISRRNLDVFAPRFKLLGDFGGNLSLNSVYEIYPALANDVFAPNTELKLKVLAPDGSIVVDNNGVALDNVSTDKSYFITVTQHGKYQAVYTAVEKDWVVENALSIVKSIFVIDESAPQVKFINATQTTAKVGDVVVIPDVVYKDNITANENMLVTRGVFNPHGQFYLMEGNVNSIKCSYAGDYRFIVMVLDEHGNMTSVTHTVTVTE